MCRFGEPRLLPSDESPYQGGGPPGGRRIRRSSSDVPPRTPPPPPPAAGGPAVVTPDVNAAQANLNAAVDAEAQGVPAMLRKRKADYADSVADRVIQEIGKYDGTKGESLGHYVHRQIRAGLNQLDNFHVGLDDLNRYLGRLNAYGAIYQSVGGLHHYARRYFARRRWGEYDL